MMNVVLIKPRSSTNRIGVERIPLSLLYIGSTLKANGHRVKIIDTNVGSRYKETIYNECEDADLVGITALTSEVKSGLAISKLIKEKFGIPIVWGGIHPTLFPLLTCEDKTVDFVVVGEGEYTLLELTNAIEKGQPFRGIKGLVYKEDGLVKVNQPRPYVDFEGLPSIDYSLIEMGRYYEGRLWRKSVDIQSSRGCPYKCKYCINPTIKNGKVRALSVKKVVDECERVIMEYGVNFITFVDDNFFINKERAKGICCEIIKRGLEFKWFAEARADFFREGFIDRDFLELAGKSGLTNLTIGAESGSPRMLALIAKDITVENIIQSATVLAKTDIITAYSFLVGFPTETRGNILETLNCIKKLQVIYPRATCAIGTLRAYPGSELTEYIIKQGWIKEPRSLQEFAEHKHNKVYTERWLKPIWHRVPAFAYSVACYSFIAFGPFTGVSIKKHLKYSDILLLPLVLLQKIAIWRLNHLFFKCSLDLYISRALYSFCYSNIARKFVRWKNTIKAK